MPGLTLERKPLESYLIECPDGSEIVITNRGNKPISINTAAPPQYRIRRAELEPESAPTPGEK